MMLSLSGKEQTLDEVWQWYDQISSALNDRKLSVKKALLSGVPVPESFVGMTAKEIDGHFQFLQNELEYSVCLAILAATEAAFFVDYWERIGNKRKDHFSKMLKKSFQNVSRPKFDKLLEKWRVGFNSCSKEFSIFKGLLKFRHWLAHGRYWVLNAGQAAYPPALVFSSIENLMDCLSTQTKIYWKQVGAGGDSWPSTGNLSMHQNSGIVATSPIRDSRIAEIMSGRANFQQGLVTTCKDSLIKSKTETMRGFWSGA